MKKEKIIKQFNLKVGDKVNLNSDSNRVLTIEAIRDTKKYPIECSYIDKNDYEKVMFVDPRMIVKIS